MSIQSAQVTATGTAVSQPARLVALAVQTGATAGAFVFRDNGAGGTTKITINLAANQAIPVSLAADDYMDFLTDIHITIPATSSATVFYK